MTHLDNGNRERKKLISVVTPCYNEELNVADVVDSIRAVFADLPQYNYEHIFIDNASQDRTVEILRKIAGEDPHVKVICNLINFGQRRSPYYATITADGDAVVVYLCDLQDPPEMIPEFIRKWEEGHQVVCGIRAQSEEFGIINLFRKLYYTIMERIAETDHIRNFFGFGLYDRSFILTLRSLDVVDPYFRGLVAEYAPDRVEIEYTHRKRRKGRSSNNFYTLYDYAMVGFASYSMIPLRLASFIGFSVAILSLLTSFAYLVYKLIFWDSFDVGVAPLVIGLFFIGAVQLFFIGMVGEYVGLIYTQVKRQPLVIEKERINFDDTPPRDDTDAAPQENR